MKSNNSLLTVKELVKHFDISGGLLDQLSLENGRIVRKKTTVKAVNAVSFTIKLRETLGVVGESGCGKSTLARAVMGLYPPNSGEIHYQDQRIDQLSPQQMLPFRKKMQMIFQDPYASLNPRMTVNKILTEPVYFHHKSITAQAARDKVAAVMRQVGVDPAWAGRYPHEFSGGQRQRISIARALMVDPEFIVADEPVSALDVSIQAQIINLLAGLKRDLGLTYLFIAHDLAVVKHISDRIAVMSMGRLQQEGTPIAIYEQPVNRFVADFIGETNFIQSTIAGIESGGARCTIGPGTTLGTGGTAGKGKGDAVTLAIRPEKIRLVKIDGGTEGLKGRVAECIYTGTDTNYQVDLEKSDVRLVVRGRNAITGETLFKVGETVVLNVTEGAARILAD